MDREEEGKQHIRKADIVLAAACLLTALFLAVCFAAGRREGLRFTLSYDGEVVETVELEGKDLRGHAVYYLFCFEKEGARWERFEEYPGLPDDAGYNLLRISETDIRMEAADCRDQICVHHKPISGGGESIICLPHKLAAQIEGAGRSGTPDGMVK